MSTVSRFDDSRLMENLAVHPVSTCRSSLAETEKSMSCDEMTSDSLVMSNDTMPNESAKQRTRSIQSINED